MRLFLLTLIFFLFPFSVTSALVNRTIDDTDLDNIKYTPSTSWRGSNNSSCFGCLNPDANHAYQQTFHYGLHAAPGQIVVRRDGGDDGRSGHGDDGSKSSGNTVTVTNTLVDTTPSPAPSPVTTPNPVDTTSSPVDTTSSPVNTAASASPNPGSSNPRDSNVMASMNFTGSAIYVYCVLPIQIDSASVLSMTNLTFLLDGHPIGSFVYDPQEDTGSTPQFQYQVPVFSKRDLPQAQHTLDIKAELGSVVLLDYVEYTTLDTASPTNSTTMPSGLAQSNGGNGGDNGSKKNALTFGLAIGLTLGVLALLSLGVCVSLIRRRRQSARLQRRFGMEEASAHASSPEMRGPEPFIPRYFPGTVVHPTRHSPPPSPSERVYEDLEEMGPSHGLNLPPAPEHASKPPYISSSGRAAGRVTGGLIDAGDEPPHYQEANRSLLVSIPFTYPPPPVPPPPGLLSPYSPASPRSPDVEDTPTSTTGLRLSPRRSDSMPVPPDESLIHTTTRERPR